jgi:hypothetical protein
MKCGWPQKLCTQLHWFKQDALHPSEQKNQTEIKQRIYKHDVADNNGWPPVLA